MLEDTRAVYRENGTVSWLELWLYIELTVSRLRLMQMVELGGRACSAGSGKGRPGTGSATRNDLTVIDGPIASF